MHPAIMPNPIPATIRLVRVSLSPSVAFPKVLTDICVTPPRNQKTEATRIASNRPRSRRINWATSRGRNTFSNFSFNVGSATRVFGIPSEAIVPIAAIPIAIRLPIHSDRPI